MPRVQTFRRGKTPVDTIRIYNSKERQYENVREAVIGGRKKDEKDAVTMFEANFRNQFFKHNSFPETKQILEKLHELYSEHKRSNKEIEL